MKWLTTLILLCLATIVTTAVSAQQSTKPYEEFGDYKVYFSVFNSTFIKPEVARVYNLTRAKDRVLINISVVKNNTFGLPAKISGQASNLMQQKKTLEFTEIAEQGATYYLASLFHLHEEVINFTIEVTPEGESKSHTVKFTRKLHQSGS
jgi:hypothetical protein